MGEYHPDKVAALGAELRELAERVNKGGQPRINFKAATHFTRRTAPPLVNAHGIITRSRFVEGERLNPAVLSLSLIIGVKQS